MIFTWNFIIMIYIYALALILLPAGGYMAWVFLILTLLFLLDLWLTLREPQLTVRRVMDNPIYQHKKTRVELLISNPTRRNIRLRLKDEIPFAFESGANQGDLTVPAGRTVQFSYEIYAPKRGTFAFGAVNLKYAGLLSLFCRQYKVDLDEEIKVYPDLTKIDGHLGRLVDSQYDRGYRRKMAGSGGELVQLREFVPGDDYRKINWKVTAHTGKLILNEYEPEKDQNVFLLFDAGRLLFDQKEEKDSRFDYILDSAILLAYNVLDHGDMAGALSFHCKVDKFIPAGKGKHHLQVFLDNFFDLQALMVESDYGAAFRFLERKINKRSLLFIYTDIADKESSRELIDYLRIIGRRHLVVCVLLKRQYLHEIVNIPLKEEKDIYLKGVALELLSEREFLKRSLVNSGIKILEVDAVNIKRSVVEHYLFLKQRGLF